MKLSVYTIIDTLAAIGEAEIAFVVSVGAVEARLINWITRGWFFRWIGIEEE